MNREMRRDEREGGYLYNFNQVLEASVGVSVRQECTHPVKTMGGFTSQNGPVQFRNFNDIYNQEFFNEESFLANQ